MSTYLGNARIISDTLMVIDGVGHLDTLPDGAVCLLMTYLNREMDAVSEILELGGAS